jgi:signal transduction histidine kinase
VALNSIQIKIVGIIVLVLLAGTAATLIVTVNNQRNDLLQSTERTLSLNTEILNTVIRNIMLSGEAPIATRTMDGLRQIEEFESVAIYRASGTAAFSDFATIDFVNERLGKIEFKQTPRAAVSRIDNPNFNRVAESHTPVTVRLFDSREMEYYFPILNRAECRGCHGESPFLRGVAHFKVSIAGIFNQIAAAGTILTILSSAIGLIIAVALIGTMQRVIIKPILAIGNVVGIVGGGNLDTQIEIKSRDELGDLGDKINGMIVGLKERNRLQIQNRVIEATNKENKKYLDNIQEGLVLIDRNFVISDQYSQFLTQLFGTEEIAGKSLIDFIYPDSKAQLESRKELEQFTGMVFNNTVTDIEMIMSINPLRDRTLTLKDGEEIVINTTFHRIFTDDEVENVMVIFEDRTSIVQAQRELAIERKRSETEIEQIAAILKVGPQAFLDFNREATQAMSELELRFEELNQDDTVRTLFRQMHSLKGTARYLGFRSMADLFHEVENVLSVAREKHQLSDSQKEQLQNLIVQVYDDLDAIKKLNDRFRTFAGVDIRSSGASVETFLSSLEEMGADIAKELDKKVRFTFTSTVDTVPFLSRMRNALIHLIRNAIDHGIEDEFERLGESKDREGSIKLSISRNPGGTYFFEIADDGRGIDFEQIRKKAVEQDLLEEAESASNAKLLQLIFQPTFSSKEEVSDISGRGVGLDIVKNAMDGLKGKISVSTKPSQGTRITLTVPPGKPGRRIADTP